MDVRFEERTRQRLDEIESDGQTRSLAPPQGIDLSSNDYLCLADDERLRRSAHDSIEKYGVGSTGSRLLRGDRESFSVAEQKFAAWKGTDRSLYFSTGYQANLAILSAFLETDDAVFSDQLNHASLIDGIRLSRANKYIFPHRDVDALRKMINETNVSGRKFIVTESLFSMDGTIAPLTDYVQLCSETSTNLFVDEAHAVGIFGKTASGIIEASGLDGLITLSVNTAGKALGAGGAFVAGPEWAIEYLVQRSRPFIFSTAPLPMMGDVLLTAIDVVQVETGRRENLLHLSTFLRDLLRENGIPAPYDISQIVPVIIGESGRAIQVATEMQALGFDVRAIRPPTVPDGTARLRISLNSGLTEDILRDFVSHLVKNL